MTIASKPIAWILGGALFSGLVLLGYQLGDAIVTFKKLDRSVVVKGLSEREYQADVVIWPIQFLEASNDLSTLYHRIDNNTAKIREYLLARGLANEEITISAPMITDKSAQYYGGARPDYRFTATQTVTVYSEKIDTVRQAMSSISELGKQGLVLSGENYMAQTEYIFTRLNDVKPEMIEEATQNARGVAEKFAEDSDSHLGKIRSASQGQFTINNRDNNTPHIKRVRVVSTIEYYLSD